MALWGNQDAITSAPKWIARKATFDATSTSVVNTTNETISLSGTNFVTGDAVVYSVNGGTAVGGLTDGTTYYLNRVDMNNVSLYDTQAHAVAGGATGKVNLTAVGTGTGHILQKDPSIVNTLDGNTGGQRVFLVSKEEAQSPENRAVGIKAQGWYRYLTYTAADNSVRHKVERVVAMNSEITETSDNIILTNDPLVEGTITIGTQPSSVAGASTPFTGTFAVAATITGNGTIGYQWQVSTDAGATYNNVSNAGVYSGATTNTLTLTAAAKVTYNNYKYRCVLSATDYTIQTSAAATLVYA